MVVSTPLKNYESQLGLLFPIYGKIKFMFQTTNQKISVLDIRNGASNHQCCFKSPQQIPAFLSISQIPCKKWKHSWWIGGYSMIFPYQKTTCWLVVSTCFNPSEKYEWVRQLGWCFLPNWMESHKINMFQTFPNQGSVSTQSIHPVFGLPWDDPRGSVSSVFDRVSGRCPRPYPRPQPRRWRFRCRCRGPSPGDFRGDFFIRNEDFPWELRKNRIPCDF